MSAFRSACPTKLLQPAAWSGYHTHHPIRIPDRVLVCRRDQLPSTSGPYAIIAAKRPYAALPICYPRAHGNLLRSAMGKREYKQPPSVLVHIRSTGTHKRGGTKSTHTTPNACRERLNIGIPCIARQHPASPKEWPGCARQEPFERTRHAVDKFHRLTCPPHPNLYLAADIGTSWGHNELAQLDAP